MSRAFSSVAHSYDVRASEERRAREPRMRCLVRFLDDSEHAFLLERSAKGAELLEHVFEHLALLETDYFGLAFRDKETLRWLEPQKRIRKQVKTSISGTQALLFRFQVKFFVSEPKKLVEEFTRFQLFLHVRNDILSGRLSAPEHALQLLASYALQSELGDHTPEDHVPGYSLGLRLAPDHVQTKDFCARAEELHRLHRGQTPADAELNFLEVARALDGYGMHVHPAKDCRGQEIELGVASHGLSVWQVEGRGVRRLNAFSWAKIVKISFKRRHFFVQLRAEGSERFEHVLGFTLESYRACKSLWKACVEQHTFFRLQSPKPHTKKFFFFFSLGSRFRYSGKTEFQSLEDNKRRLARQDRAFVRSRSTRPLRQTVPAPNHVANLMHGQLNGSVASVPRVTSRVSESDASRPKSAWHSSNGSVSSQSLAFAPSHALPFIDTPSESTQRLSLCSDESPVHVVTLRMRPDAEGRFGFNVKGGSDQKCPVLVSRVAPNTPADVAKLREGDQLLQINGEDVSHMTHEQIVQLIRTRGRGLTDELALVLRPTVYARDAPEEPFVQYIPLSKDLSPTATSALDESIELLREALDSGALLLQFEQLPRKKAGEPMTAARLPDNLPKNRYRDISPYDSTRVVLRDSLTGDYINASFVSMEINRQVNRYIATQGPLRETQDDFWLMLWEQHVPLVVMVTPLEEKGRNKCHKYWPEAHETSLHVFGLFHVTLVAQSESRAVTERLFSLKDDKEERVVTHLQYLAWPDHGVPDRDQDFLELVARVRRVRQVSPQPVVVHCSAGIGRTGVLVLMETGLCLLEAREPLFPLELLRTMRDQRAMLIQTAQQFRFVCEALLRAYQLVTCPLIQ